MDVERVLGLDMSTKTGFTLLISDASGMVLEEYGQIPQIHTPEGAYPESFIIWSHAVVDEIVKVIERLKPNVLVIEETAAGSKAIYTQKILEWIHYLVAKYIVDKRLKVVYIMTGQWRSEIGCSMSKEESKHNKTVKEYKKKNSTSLAYDISGKRIGKITKKHVNVRRINEIFGKYLKTPLKMKDEDAADSLGLAYAYHLRRIARK
jgi:Holliday junction resolvasome RuvABC endonuclease subunit